MTDMPVYISGLEQSISDEIERRITEFEELHEKEVADGGSGWVPRVKTSDFLSAGVINVIILVYYVWAIMG